MAALRVILRCLDSRLVNCTFLSQKLPVNDNFTQTITVNVAQILVACNAIITFKFLLIITDVNVR